MRGKRDRGNKRKGSWMRKKGVKIVLQTIERPLPTNVEMVCECGLVFTSSAILTSHMFSHHISSKDSQTKMNPVLLHQDTQNLTSTDEIEQFINQSSNMRVKRRYRRKKVNYQGNRILFNVDANQMEQCKVEAVRENDEEEREKEYSQYKESETSKAQAKVEPTEPSSQTVQPFKVLQPGEFFTHKVFQCGSCLTLYNYREELTIHITLHHQGEFPEGSMFGPSKYDLYDIFGISYTKQINNYETKMVKRYKCGCGRTYGSSSSMVSHIQARHECVAPVGTVGLPNTKCVQRVVFEDGIKAFVPWEGQE